MRAYSSTPACCNLLSWPVTSRFADHLSAISAGTDVLSRDVHHDLNSPIHHDRGSHLFLSCPLSAPMEYLDPKVLKGELQRYRRLRTDTSRAAAGRG